MKALLIDGAQGDSPRNPYRQALHHRVTAIGGEVPASSNASVLQLLWAARNVSSEWDFARLVQVVEREDWQYRIRKAVRKGVEGAAEETVVTGPSMVCCVVVCRVWKAARPFECAEQTLWNLFDQERLGGHRPAPCAKADGNATLCQVAGRWSVSDPTPDFNTRGVYPHMGNHCPSLAPNYDRASEC